MQAVQEARSNVLELIEVALVELREIAQPHELAALNELRLDAEEAQTEDVLRKIADQAKGLREFCEKRTRSGMMERPPLPSGRRRL